MKHVIYQGENDYADFVQSKVKSGARIKEEMSSGQAHILHMSLGFVQEAAELSDQFKKWAIYQKQLDLENVREELGDALFFMTAIMTHFGISFTELQHLNRSKLDERYKEGYSNEEAQTRNDKPIGD